jgi:hypothetical protein
LLGGDEWSDDLRLSDLEPHFIFTACRKRGADIRPDFHWDEPGALTRAIDENNGGGSYQLRRIQSWSLRLLEGRGPLGDAAYRQLTDCRIVPQIFAPSILT